MLVVCHWKTFRDVLAKIIFHLSCITKGDWINNRPTELYTFGRIVVQWTNNSQLIRQIMDSQVSTKSQIKAMKLLKIHLFP